MAVSRWSLSSGLHIVNWLRFVVTTLLSNFLKLHDKQDVMSSNSVCDYICDEKEIQSRSRSKILLLTHIISMLTWAKITYKTTTAVKKYFLSLCPWHRFTACMSLSPLSKTWHASNIMKMTVRSLNETSNLNTTGRNSSELLPSPLLHVRLYTLN